MSTADPERRQACPSCQAEMEHRYFEGDWKCPECGHCLPPRDERNRATVAEVLAGLQRSNALSAAAEKLERLARWKFEAGNRIWRASGYGDLDKRAGEKGLMLCGEAGQMERDALIIRGTPKRRRQVR